MSDQILPAFGRFKNEGAIVGRLLAGYSDLEFEMAVCLGTYLADVDLGLRTLFRVRGEDQRIQISDALMREAFKDAELYEPYCEAISAITYCKKIRNQYAHCHWYDTPETGLCFTQMENWAKKSKVALKDVDKRPIDEALLQKQEAYFRYTIRCFWYLTAEYDMKVGRLTNHIWKLPEKVDKPLLYNTPTKARSNFDQLP